MIRISQLRLPCGSPPEALETKIRKTLKLELKGLEQRHPPGTADTRTSGSQSGKPFYRIARHSVDARKKPQLLDIYTVDVETGLPRREETALLKRLRNKNAGASPPDPYRFPAPGPESLQERPVIIGAGPAGLFCALFLAEHGYRPLLIERGKRMEDRAADVERFWQTGVLDPGSNVQFGEGGAGTFSDGKLNTQINDRTGRSGQVLRIFAEAGAPESILYEAKPHIGTDRLRAVIPAIRKRIEAAGGEVLFETMCAGLVLAPAEDQPSDGFSEEEFHPDDVPPRDDTLPPRQLRGIYVKKTGDAASPPVFLPARAVVLAIGHSARDTIHELLREGIPMRQKQFAVGFRVAHPQTLIDRSQYGFSDPEQLLSMRLSAAPYKLTAKASSGRGVYSFCMCPGGYIVNASSEHGHLCVNGMSDEGRDSGWANSAVVITVGEKEFGSRDILAGLRFQRMLEQKAWELGKGRIPVQMYTDFRSHFQTFFSDDEKTRTPVGNDIPDFSKKGTCVPAPLHTLLPEELTADFIEGMEQFGQKIAGFNGERTVVAGIETRTSSPVRILRGGSLESVGAAGLYPCGEGAGYAGGIMSAAMDGIRAAEAIARKYHFTGEGEPSKHMDPSDTGSGF